MSFAYGQGASPARVEPRAGIEPFFFGLAKSRLFGIYDLPARTPMSECGVVLCYPTSREYLLAHRAYRHLALRLAEAGIPAMRFDYFGTGDSFGNSEDSTLAQMLGDATAAMREIRSGCGSRRLCLLGMRLGGSVALLTGHRSTEVGAMVLWNPVLCGKTYMEEAVALHRRMFADTMPRLEQDQADSAGILGFPMPSVLKSELATLRLSPDRKPAERVLLVDTGARRKYDELASQLEALGTEVEYLYSNTEPVWLEAVYKSQVPTSLIGSIVSWIRENA
jgi:hypothetical protein